MGARDVARLDRELATVLGARPRDPKACADVLERAAFACRTDPAAAEQSVEAELWTNWPTATRRWAGWTRRSP
jgi:hypothetical protein